MSEANLTNTPDEKRVQVHESDLYSFLAQTYQFFVRKIGGYKCALSKNR